MKFRGKVDRESHEGGLLVSFTGEAPHLGTSLETGDGTYIGRVDTVIGRVDCALVHILPIARELDVSSIGDSEISIQQRRQRDDRRNNDRRGGRQEHRGRGRNDRYDRRGQGGDRRGGDRSRSGGNRGGDRGGNDWECPECRNNNFAWRDTCNRCPTKRPKNAGGAGGRSNYGGNRGGNRDNRGGRGNYGGNRGGNRDNRGGRGN
ncbi:MAG: zinc finger protein, partial [Candidatus Thalassarchaeaceae archaeon]|nr:zinc finger protein [Candidatus Thalassarchaeaceae archaeon]